MGYAYERFPPIPAQGIETAGGRRNYLLWYTCDNDHKCRCIAGRARLMNKKTVPLNHHRLRGTVLLFHDSFTPELCQHLQHVDADLLWIIIQTGADDAETIRCQNPAMQLVVQVLLVFLIFLIQYLLHTIDLSSFRTFSKLLHVRMGIRLSISSILLSHHLSFSNRSISSSSKRLRSIRAGFPTMMV